MKTLDVQLRPAKIGINMVRTANIQTNENHEVDKVTLWLIYDVKLFYTEILKEHILGNTAMVSFGEVRGTDQSTKRISPG